MKIIGNYKIGKTIGVGSFGKVKECFNRDTNELCAVKILSKRKIKKQGLISVVRQEIAHYALLPPHDHVIELSEVLESDTHLYIIMECATRGEMYEKVLNEGVFDETDALHYFRQLLDGLDFVHQQRLCHRDLKLENLLLDPSGTLKISDFGLSGLRKDLQADREFMAIAGSPNYIAPEIIAGRGYDGFEADVWSAGVCLYVLLAGYLPFDEGSDLVTLFKKISLCEVTFPSSWSSELVDLFTKIFVADPKDRITLGGIMQHPWVIKGEIVEAHNQTSEPIAFTEMQLSNAVHTVSTPCDIRIDQDGTLPDYGHVEGQMREMSENNLRLTPQNSALSIRSRSPSARSISHSPSFDDRLIPQVSKKKKEGTFAFWSSDEDEESESSHSVNKTENGSTPSLQGLNAFEIIALSTGSALSSLLTTQTDDNDSTPFTCFHSNLDADELLASVEKTCLKMEGVEIKVYKLKYKIRLRLFYHNVHLRVNIEIKEVPDSQMVVECYRHKGAVVTYREWYEDFRRLYQEAYN